MSWVFHLLWMFLVLMLFFIVLRRIYYFGLQVHRPAAATSRTQTSQRFAVFTIYQNELRPTGPQQQPSERSQPPAYPEPPPPPKYDEVIKSPDLFQKPPPYTATAEA
ncbi:uncharacterized protein LOC126565673 [Anopheles maculipalpis]|uniref:uncharacterized protein LOC126565673 n=1 Tax=Anopheles maculipalpis TaxID=1496333 RepID=UPI002159555F|nr:uncharacterized protein LOC126565673 [Anopheles maculipalpis]